MNDTDGVPARILKEAAYGLGLIDTGKTTLDDFLDLHLRHPELRRSVSSLLFQCFRRRRYLEDWIDHLAQRPPRPEVRRLLLVVLAQAVFQSGIAKESLVNVAVDLAKLYGRPAEARFVNAILRQAMSWPQPISNAPEAVFPDILFMRWQKRYSKSELSQLATALLTQPDFTFRAERNFDPHDLASGQIPSYGGFRFYRTNSIPRLLASDAMHDGSIYIQDPATSLAPSLPDFTDVKKVLDLCAAPGGKALMLGERLDWDGALVAADVSERRQQQTAENFRRRGLDYQVVVAEPKELTGQYDLVMADVPCSNTGVFRRRPDVLWRFSQEELGKLVGLQQRILREATRLVVPGGQLLYSTCSIEPEENGQQIERFLTGHSGFELVCSHSLLPSSESDGAYACLLRRKSGC